MEPQGIIEAGTALREALRLKLLSILDLTLVEAAKIAKCNPATLRHHINEGHLIAVKRGKTWLVTREALDKFLADETLHKPGVKAAPLTFANGSTVSFTGPADTKVTSAAEPPVLDSPAWQAKHRLEYVKEQNRQGAATFEQVCEAADAYIAEIKAWAKLKGVKVRLPNRASLTR